MPRVFATRVSVDEPEPPGTLFVLSEPVSPALEIDTDRSTVPVNPFVGPIVIVEVSVRPAFTARPAGPAVTLKSWTW